MTLTRRGILRTGAAGAVGAGALATGPGSVHALPFGGDCPEPDGVSKTDVTIESHDGTSLAATVYEPRGTGPFPAVLMTHGWGMTKEMIACEALRYADAGYLVLAYDSRGFGGSGDIVDVNGPDEVADVSVLLDWLAAHEAVDADGDDPRVGMDGMSYGGGIQLLAAAVDDRIDAIVPRITWNDLVASGAPNDAIKAGWLGLLIGFGELSSRVTGEFTDGVNPDLVDWYLEALKTNDFPAGAVEYFAERSPDVSQIDVPTLVISGWADTLFPPSEAVANYRGVSGESRLVMYSAGHSLRELGVSDAEHSYMDDVSLRWLDRHVKGEDVAAVPEVSLWDGEGWSTSPSFPPTVEPVVTGLDELGGRRSRVRNSQYWFDRVARYDLESSGFTIAGSPRVRLSVTTRGELILFCSLVHVSGWSRERIDDQVVPVRVQDGSHEVVLDLEPLYREIPAGDTLRLEVSASDPQKVAFLDEYGRAMIDNRESTWELPVA